MLILQCDLTDISAGCIKLAKFIIEQFRNELITKKDQMEQTIKHVCIILHIHRGQEPIQAPFNFMCGWKQITVGCLDKELSLHNLLDNSLYDIVSSEHFKKIVDPDMPFEKLFKDELQWCFSCLKYPFP